MSKTSDSESDTDSSGALLESSNQEIETTQEIDDHFMSIASLAANRSKEETKVGACIVNKDNKVVSIGYNEQCKNERGKILNVCDAAVNAIFNRNCGHLRGCTIYVTTSPCHKCAQLIIQSGIERVVFYSTNHEFKRVAKAVIVMFKVAGILCEQDPKIETEDEMMSLAKAVAVENKKIKIETGKEIDHHFMLTASLAANNSKGSKTKVGACIVNKYNKVVAIGFNDFSSGCEDKVGQTDEDIYVCHAELNAIVNTNRFDLRGCTIYVTMSPCDECAKLIIQSGIVTRVVFLSEYIYSANHKLKAAGILCEQLKVD